ncbi:MAG TPA: glycosyltransferase family 4 protein [Candidatus Paceibacterota bacterium]|nr:glycosyltransferase family 4 protein [Candidatus Paceibacterota bacterium]
MRILIATGIYPPQHGGPAIYAESLKGEFEKLGHVVTVRTYRTERRLPTGIRHFFYLIKTAPAFLRSDMAIVLDTFSVGLPVAFLQKLAPRCVLLRTGGDFLWEAYVERTKEKILLSEFYTKPRALTFKERLILRATKFTLQAVSRIIFSTAYQQGIWKDAYDIPTEKTAIIENAYALGEVHLRPPPVTKTFVSFCRPIVLKNIPLLCEAFALAKAKHPEIELEAGYALPHSELMERMKSAYAVVIPSLSEVSPNLALEALSLGIPVILTRENGVMDRIGKAVIAVDPTDVHDIARAIVALADDAVHRRCQETIKTLSFRHSYAAIADEFLFLAIAPSRTESPAILLGNDPSMADPRSESVARMVEYASLHTRLDVFTYAGRTGVSEIYRAGENAWMHLIRGGKSLAFLVIGWKGYRHALAEDAKIVIAQDASLFGVLAWLIARLTGARFAVGIYGTDPTNSFFKSESLKHRFYAALAKRVLRRADAIQTDGPETVEHLRREYGSKVFFKPMFPSNVAELARVTRSMPETLFRVLFIGRFVPQKNIPLLADVIHETARRNDGIVFSIVGDGPEKRRFIEEIRKRSLQDRVEDKGVLSRTEILDAYSNHHLLLITSRYEGFPRVFMEAALTGMPIVTTRVGGVTGLIEDGVTGFVVPQGTSAGEIAEKIITLADDRALLSRMSHALKERWGTLYGGKTVLDYQRPIKEYLDSHKA